MLLAVFSDLHDNLANLHKILNYCSKNKITTLVSCGDLANRQTFDYLLKNFAGDFFYVFGNNEEFLFHPQDDLESLSRANPRFHFFPQKIGTFKIESLHIAITHFPYLASRLAQEDKYDFVFFGHTHKPDIQKINKTILLNPGTAGGVSYAPSFAVIDTSSLKPQLVLLNEIK